MFSHLSSKMNYQDAGGQVLRAVPSVLTLSLEAQLLPLQGALLCLGLPMAALGRVLGAQPLLLLSNAEIVEAQVLGTRVMPLVPRLLASDRGHLPGALLV